MTRFLWLHGLFYFRTGLGSFWLHAVEVRPSGIAVGFSLKLECRKNRI